MASVWAAIPQTLAHGETERKAHARFPSAPTPATIPSRIRCLHRDHSIAAAQHTRRQRAPCERQNARRYCRVSLLHTKLLFKEARRQLCHDAESVKGNIHLCLFPFEWLFYFCVGKCTVKKWRFSFKIGPDFNSVLKIKEFCGDYIKTWSEKSLLTVKFCLNVCAFSCHYLLTAWPQREQLA